MAPAVELGVRFARQGCVHGTSGGSGHGSGDSRHLPTSVSPLVSKRPFVSAANATSERSVSQRVHRKRYVTFQLRNALQVNLSDSAAETYIL